MLLGVVIVKNLSQFGSMLTNHWPEKSQYELVGLTVPDSLPLPMSSAFEDFLRFSCKDSLIGLFDDFFQSFKFTYFSLKGDSSYQYEGDRTRDDIVNFALRLVGASVNKIESKSDFEAAKKRSELFFIFSGEMSGIEWENYEKIATHLQQHEFFYQADATLAEKLSGVKETQTIRIYKDGHSFKFDGKYSF